LWTYGFSASQLLADCGEGEAVGINSAGTVIGPGFIRARDGSISYLTAPGIGGLGASAINPAGEITGYYYDKTGNPNVAHGYVRTPDGAITSFDAPGAPQTLPQAINASGGVAGYTSSGNSPEHAFVRTPSGEIQVFDVGEGRTYAVGIDSTGAVAGDCTILDESGRPRTRGFIRSADGSITLIQVPGSSGTSISAMAPNGIIVGSYQGDPRGFFIRSPSGVFTTFELAEDYFPYAAATDVNSAGSVVGYYFSPPDYLGHGFVRDRDGNIEIFDVPGYNGVNRPLSINAQGEIAGSAYIGTGECAGLERAFIRSPKGEFTTFEVPAP